MKRNCVERRKKEWYREGKQEAKRQERREEEKQEEKIKTSQGEEETGEEKVGMVEDLSVRETTAHHQSAPTCQGRAFPPR